MKVGLLDIDVHGPSIPKLLGIEGHPLGRKEHSLLPVDLGPIRAMSIAFLLPDRDNPVIWRGPMKHNVIKQFISDVDWGELDYLVVDSPPGTGDEPLSVVQLVPDADGAVIVTTPQELAVSDVRKCISFCRTLNLTVLGVVENMRGFVCPKCGTVTEIFKSGGGETMAREMGVPFLGSIPLDPDIVAASDSGTPYLGSAAKTPTEEAFNKVVANLLPS
jgi:Mrp family chromosome partitioning ATPase